ncbi:MAG: RNA-binding protein [candidate division Zixibacteria bacterium]|nr:RNA-binding protein [candidate division Zixibacteria bacterium]MDH3938510.1 RNA-binding protein [candidate division Zixibacteria bacterium]MDH4032864.1 RNA-binding protein [candidate division Zixibacteria bacterium]
MNLYVGNLSPKTTEWQLRKAFARHGKVSKISMGKQPPEGDPFGFCFVEMPFDSQASRAITQLNGEKLGGYALNVKESGVNV